VHLLRLRSSVCLTRLYFYTYPPRFTDPNWEVQTIRALVEHAATLAGADACLYRHQGYIGKREKISWGFILGFPVGGAAISVDDSLRIIDTGIYHASNAQIAAQLSQQRQQFQQIKDKLNQATTDEQQADLRRPRFSRSLAEN